MKTIKRITAAALLLCVLFCAPTQAAGLSEIESVAVKLRSDLAGATEDEYDRCIELQSDNVVFTSRGDGPVSVSDYSGDMEQSPLVAGRTYYIDYTLEAADGYELPDNSAPVDVKAECEDGVTVIYSRNVSANIRQKDGSFKLYKGLQITARVVVKGNIFERIIGFFYDIYLKIRAWSLY